MMTTPQIVFLVLIAGAIVTYSILNKRVKDSKEPTYPSQGGGSGNTSKDRETVEDNPKGPEHRG